MVPEKVKQFLWSYDVKKINLKDDSKIIVFNMLNYGDMYSIKWLLKNYSKKEIVENANCFPETSWNKKSLNFWKVKLKINPKKTRF